MAALKPGQEIGGIVTRIADFGAFVDFGGNRDGLVPRSKMSEGFVENVRDVVAIGDAVTTWVSEVTERGVTLAMAKSKVGNSRGPAVKVDLTDFEGLDAQWLEGSVDRIVPYGAFVTATSPKGTTAVGLLHASQIRDGFVDNVDELLEVGQSVKVKVLSVDNGAGKLSLSMKEGSPDTGGKASQAGTAGGGDLTEFEALPDTQWLDGIVKSVVNFGAFVEVTPPSGGPASQGLVHVSQLRDGFVDNVDELLEVGQSVKVKVLSVDKGAGKLALSMREGSPDTGGKASQAGTAGGGDLTEFAALPDTQWLDGIVNNFANFGAFVEVTPPSGGPTTQGLVHISQIKEGFIEDPAEELEIDQEVKVRVIEVKAGKLSLSMLEKAEAPAPEPA